MALKITKSHDPITVSQLVVCVFSGPGTGKTTLAQTASRPILLDFDKGVHRAAIRKDSVQVDSWADVDGMTAEDLEPFDTVIVDTAGRALDSLAMDIMVKEPKMGRNGSLTLQGYGQLKARFVAWLKMLRSFGKDVILIAHSDEQRDGDNLIERLDMQGASKGEVHKSADLMGRLYLQGNQRILNFSPTDSTFGKNPAQLPPLNVPLVTENPNFMAEIIEQVKAKLNELTAEQQEVVSIMADWNAKISAAETLEDINKLVHGDIDPRVAKVVKGLIHKRATALGFKPDKDAGEYRQEEAA